MDGHSDRLRLLAASLVLLTLLLCSGCRGCRSASSGGGAGREPIQPPPPEQMKFSDYKPDNPFAESAPGVMDRTWFGADGDNGYRVEVKDLLVGKSHNSELRLPGAGVFEVRLGSGVVYINGKPQQFESGSAFTVAEGEAFRVERRGEEPVAFRLYLLKSN